MSRFVHQLEERLGGQLVDRSKRPLQPTVLGQAYYEGCKRLLEQYTELEVSLRQAQSERALTVRVAAIYSVGLGDMGQYVERFQARQPQCESADGVPPPGPGLSAGPRRTGRLRPRVVPRPLARPDRAELARGRDGRGLRPGHSLARFKRINPARLDGEKYVAFDKRLVIRREVDRFLRDHGVRTDVAFEFDSIENIKKAVEVGTGFALLPEPTIRQEVQAGTLLGLRLDGARMVRPLGIIHRRQHKLGSAALAFIDLLRHDGAARNATDTALLDSTPWRARTRLAT